MAWEQGKLLEVLEVLKVLKVLNGLPVVPTHSTPGRYCRQRYCQLPAVVPTPASPLVQQVLLQVLTVVLTVVVVHGLAPTQRVAQWLPPRLTACGQRDHCRLCWVTPVSLLTCR